MCARLAPRPPSSRSVFPGMGQEGLRLGGALTEGSHAVQSSEGRQGSKEALRKVKDSQTRVPACLDLNPGSTITGCVTLVRSFLCASDSSSVK